MKSYKEYIYEGIRDKMTPRTVGEVDVAIDKLLHRFPELGKFDYKKYGFTINFDKSALDKPKEASSIHFVFMDKDGNRWDMFIDKTGKRIEFMSGMPNVHKLGSHNFFYSFEELDKKLEQFGYKKLNESVRDLMTGKSPEDAIRDFELSDKTKKVELVWDMLLTRFYNKGNEIEAFMRNTYQKLGRGSTQQSIVVLWDELEKLSEEELTKFARTMLDLDMTNESVRNKMTPKPTEYVNDILSKMSPNHRLSRGAEEGLPWMVKNALDAGADVHYLDDIALCMVCDHNYTHMPMEDRKEIIKLLMDAGANMHARSSSAVKYSSMEIEKLLRQYKSYNHDNPYNESVRDKMTGRSDKQAEWIRTNGNEISDRFEEHFKVKVTETRVYRVQQLIALKFVGEVPYDELKKWFDENTNYYIDQIGRTHNKGEIFLGINPKKKK